MSDASVSTWVEEGYQHRCRPCQLVLAPAQARRPHGEGQAVPGQSRVSRQWQTLPGITALSYLLLHPQYSGRLQHRPCSHYQVLQVEARNIVSTVFLFRYYAGWADKTHGKTIPVDGSFLSYTR